MSGRLRRRARFAEPVADEGPFVSFTDLFIGILFLFLILVAALMLIHQEAMQRAKAEAERLSEQIRQLQAELDAIKKLDVDHTPFRLAIVYNSFQKPGGSQQDWRFTRTVQIFRAPNGQCLENVLLRNNLNLAWKPEVQAPEIPNVGDARTSTSCTLSGSGERWNSATETGGVNRVSANLYRGYTVLHTKDGDKSVDIEFRILGVFDDYFRPSGSQRTPLPPPAASSAPPRPTGAISLQ